MVEILAVLSPALIRKKFIILLLYCIQDCIEDMVTFTALIAETFFQEISRQYKGSWTW